MATIPRQLRRRSNSLLDFTANEDKSSEDVAVLAPDRKNSFLDYITPDMFYNAVSSPERMADPNAQRPAVSDFIEGAVKEGALTAGTVGTNWMVDLAAVLNQLKHARTREGVSRPGSITGVEQPHFPIDFNTEKWDDFSKIPGTTDWHARNLGITMKHNLPFTLGRVGAGLAGLQVPVVPGMKVGKAIGNRLANMEPGPGLIGKQRGSVGVPKKPKKPKKKPVADDAPELQGETEEYLIALKKARLASLPYEYGIKTPEKWRTGYKLLSPTRGGDMRPGMLETATPIRLGQEMVAVDETPLAVAKGVKARPGMHTIDVLGDPDSKSGLQVRRKNQLDRVLHQVRTPDDTTEYWQRVADLSRDKAGGIGGNIPYGGGYVWDRVRDPMRISGSQIVDRALSEEEIAELYGRQALENIPDEPVLNALAAQPTILRESEKALDRSKPQSPTSAPRVEPMAQFRQWKRSKYVGAPTGVTTPAHVQAHIDEYAARVRAAIAAGAKPGYFYDEGAKIIRGVTEGDKQAYQFARTNAVTSSEAPVHSNVGWAIKGHEQSSMGVPIHTGKYPNQERANLVSILQGRNNLNIGKDKRQLYGSGLYKGSKDNFDLAPNDRWEISAIFGPSKKTATDKQHEYIHAVREGARLKLAREGLDLTPLQAQELNWAQVKAVGENKTALQVAEGETVQSSVPGYAFSHTWEAAPGAPAHFEGMPPAMLDDFHKTVRGAVIDPVTRKGRLISAMGAEFQLPAIDGPGVYKGTTSPGTTSRSLIYQKGREIDPTSQARIEGTESTRALMLGQEGYAGNLVVPAKKTDPLKSLDAISVSGVRLSDKTAKKVDALLNERFPGKADPITGEADPTYAITNTTNGFSILNLGNKKFADNFEGISNEIRNVLGENAQAALGRQVQPGLYGELDWVGGNATRDMLEQINNPNAPRLREHADSPAMRQVAGDIADAYDALKASGAGMPNAKLLEVLRVWSRSGLEGVEAMVKAGTAPAVALGVLSGFGLSNDRAVGPPGM